MHGSHLQHIISLRLQVTKTETLSPTSTQIKGGYMSVPNILALVLSSFLVTNSLSCDQNYVFKII